MPVDIEKDAKALLDNAKKKNAEARGAAKGSSPKNQKTKEEIEKEEEVREETQKAEQAERDKKDKAILSKKDEELNEDERKRKAELADIKKKEDEKILSTPDDRLDEVDKKKKEELKKAKPSKLELRVHELVDEIGKLKKEKKQGADDKKRIKILEGELADVKKSLSMSPEDIFRKKMKEDEARRIEQYTKEDEKLPREERREMSKEELDEWIADDLAAATEWIAYRASRRINERNKSSLMALQKVSYAKVLKENPKMDLDKAVERGKALKEEGKDNEEVSRILAEEFPEAFISFAVAEEMPHLQRRPNGPELVAEEVKRRLSKKPEKEHEKGQGEEASEISELKSQLTDVRAELDRLKGVDVSLASNRSPGPVKEDSEMGKKLSNLATEVKLDPKKVAARVKERERKGYGR